MENLLFLGVPKIWAYYSLIIMCLNSGTPNNHHFPIGTNGKVVVLGVPILKHFRVLPLSKTVTGCIDVPLFLQSFLLEKK